MRAQDFIVIGLTGSIGMGKSTAGAIFQTLGVSVFDSDDCIRRVMGPRGKAVKDVVAHFPDVWDHAKKRIDRNELANIVFSDPDERKRLEAVLHPYVWEEQDRFKKQMRRNGRKMVVLDIPLLFETGADERVDVTVVISAPPYIQYQRVMARPDMTEEKFFNILESQMPDHHKRLMADYVVPSGLGRGVTTRKIKQIVHDLRLSLEPEPLYPVES